MIDKFTNIYETRRWGKDESDEFRGSSGKGSRVDQNINTYIPFLKKFINENNIKTISDLGCGTFYCGETLYDDLDIIYNGYDAYEKVVNYNANKYKTPKYNFKHIDVCADKEIIKGGDLCILKDILQHWEGKYIYELLDYFVETKKYKYILIINCCNQKTDDQELDKHSMRPLNCKYNPLKKYNATKIYKYSSKEVCLITL